MAESTSAPVLMGAARLVASSLAVCRLYCEALPHTAAREPATFSITIVIFEWALGGCLRVVSVYQQGRLFLELPLARKSKAVPKTFIVIFGQGLLMLHQSADHLSAVAREEAERLKTLDFLYLTTLPESTAKQVIADGQTITVTTWHDVLATGEHRIVAQASKKTRFGFGVYLSADGFAIANSGQVRALSAEELASFM